MSGRSQSCHSATLTRTLDGGRWRGLAILRGNSSQSTCHAEVQNLALALVELFEDCCLTSVCHPGDVQSPVFNQSSLRYLISVFLLHQVLEVGTCVVRTDRGHAHHVLLAQSVDSSDVGIDEVKVGSGRVDDSAILVDIMFGSDLVQPIVYKSAYTCEAWRTCMQVV